MFWTFYSVVEFGKIYWITKCTTTDYFLPLFSSLLKKKREEEKENEVAKPVLNHFFSGSNRFSPFI